MRALGPLFCLPLIAACAPFEEPGPALIFTDRPSFTTAPKVVPPGRVQLETGAFWVGDDEGGVRRDRAIVPNTLLRVGLAEWVELRGVWGGYGFDWREGQDRVDGITDVGLGAKASFVDHDGVVPEVAVEGVAVFDTGSEAFGNRGTDGLGRLALGWDLGDSTYFVGNFVVASRAFGGDRTTQFSGSAFVCQSFGSRTSVYGEWFVIDPPSSGQGAAHSLGFGAQWLATRSLAFDARIGFGLTDSAEDIFSGVGLGLVF